MDDIGIHIHVTGLVQGVGYRYFVFRNATALELRGYVRNMPDGSVEVHAEGPKGILRDFLDTLRTGPRLSNVTDLSVEWTRFEGKYTTFEIR